MSWVPAPIGSRHILSLPQPTWQPARGVEVQIEAEKMILAANGEGGLATIALRPSTLYGEWNKLMVPMLVALATRARWSIIGVWTIKELSAMAAIVFIRLVSMMCCPTTSGSVGQAGAEQFQQQQNQDKDQQFCSQLWKGQVGAGILTQGISWGRFEEDIGTFPKACFWWYLKCLQYWIQ